MKEIDPSTERLVWIVSGALSVGWVTAILVNFWSPRFWDQLPEQGVRLATLNSPLTVASVLLLVDLLMAGFFYRMGMAELKKQAATERKFRQALEDVYRGTLQTLTLTLDERDGETYGHSQRVMRYSLAIGRQLGLGPQDMQTLAWGALLHDLGKIGIPDSILRKPAALTPDEMKHMREHVLIGFQMVSGIPFLGRASLVVRHHHERWDGAGYPDGLRGEEIPTLARIFSVADAYDAMTSSRPYRLVPLMYEEALAVLKNDAGRQFCPTAVEAFARVTKPELEQVRTGSYTVFDHMGPLVWAEENGELLSNYYQDVLTGTKNRTAWEAKKSQLAHVRGGKLGTVVFVDVDRLKQVNDAHGHHLGDKVLGDLGVRLSSLTSEVYRIGGDEFVLWFPQGLWGDALQKQLELLAEEYTSAWAQLSPGPSLSWGIGTGTQLGETLAELQIQADQSMYRQKSARHGGIQPASPAV